ncbi:CocE/NonD family hydrolase [Streptomyces sp. NPDC085932]|uniref:CocE/NonD family hydrolase n=1 Tax=Streptomyces sp. NPDC085932 TaxID=3365741 RepID=UPI0037D1CE72
MREKDVEVAMPDGVVLRVDVYRSADSTGPLPVILSAHPYGKDRLPKPRKGGGYRPIGQFRVFRHPEPIHLSAWTGWEAPDPAIWCRRGYAVVNADLRGFGKSEGVGSPFSDQEARDLYELVEWAGTRPWSSGKVGLDGVSYLAISQYKAAALRPPHLAAICPWEGFTDFYRDYARPGGIREDGFMTIWSLGLKRAGRVDLDIRAEQRSRDLFDDWYEALRPHLEQIQVPALVCASFSDHALHSRGSFEAFRRIRSRHKWLYTHRGGKWCTYYGAEAVSERQKFFDWALKGMDNGQEALPPVRLEVRDRGDAVQAVRREPSFPPPGVTWHKLYLDAAAGQLVEARGGEPTEGPQGSSESAPPPATAAFDHRRGTASFSWTIQEDLEVIGPMALRLWVQLQGGTDAHLYAGVRKLSEGREVTFEGSFGFGRDLVTKGSLRASFREADAALSMPGSPVHAHRTRRPFEPGEIAPVDIALLPSATFFRAGDVLRLDVQGRWFFPVDPIRGQFPTRYERAPHCATLLHTGGVHDAHLLVPVKSLARTFRSCPGDHSSR